MEIADFLEKPDRSPASDEEQEALGEILTRCASANTALLWLYRVALISHQENEESLDRIELLDCLHRAEIRELKGLPSDEWHDPLRAPQ
ncbi:hypothetical protein AB4037_17855 [Labrys sp. KB_33_2]|uniref:hypothetical protein n=1 Tax=Labrys sp. KB_33_2 TaxID=3237479 RepID=UPI003F923850